MKKIISLLFTVLSICVYAQDFEVPLNPHTQRYVVWNGSEGFMYGRGFDEDSNRVVFVVVNPNKVAYNGTRFSWLLSDNYKYDLTLRDSLGNELARDLLSYEGGFTRSAFDGEITKSISAGVSNTDKWLQMTNSMHGYALQSFVCSFNRLNWNASYAAFSCASDTNNSGTRQLVQATPQFIDLHWGYDGSQGGNGVRLSANGFSVFKANHEKTVSVDTSGYLVIFKVDSAYIATHTAEQGAIVYCTDCPHNGYLNCLMYFDGVNWRKL